MTIKCYQLTPDGITPLAISASTLDEMTRALPRGFYTTFTTLAGGTKVLSLRDHLQRLYIPAQEMNLTPAVDEKDLRKHLAALAGENLPKESRLRLILTKENGEVYVGAEPFEPLPESVYRNGVRVVTTRMARHDPRIKDTYFIAESLAQRKLLGGDVFEVLLTKNGRILEGMTSNFYAVKYVIANRWSNGGAAGAPYRDQAAKQSQPSSGELLTTSWRTSAGDRRPHNDITLITACQGILHGVTRSVVLKLAKREGLRVEYRAPRVDEYFDEAFLTSSSRGVVPVIQIDGELVGQGRVGEVARQLSKSYQMYLQTHAERI